MMNFEDMLRLSQKDLKAALEKELIKLGYVPVNKKGFLYAPAVDKSPVLLVAHMDTVHLKLPKIICRSNDGRFLMSPSGIGGDDRCGCYMILEIIKSLKCHVLFCEDEETGGQGAKAFCKSGIAPDVNYIVELDRKGHNDAVFYDDANDDFVSFIKGFGFREDYGTFSDICEIAPYLGVSAVNLSCGYYNAHTAGEMIDLKVMEENIGRVKELLTTQSGAYEYVPFKAPMWGDFDVLPLMNVGDGFVVTDGGQLVDGSEYFIDQCGEVYEYDWDADVAFQVECRAYTKNGTALRYCDDEAEPMQVIIA